MKYHKEVAEAACFLSHNDYTFVPHRMQLSLPPRSYKKLPFGLSFAIFGVIAQPHQRPLVLHAVFKIISGNTNVLRALNSGLPQRFLKAMPLIPPARIQIAMEYPNKR